VNDRALRMLSLLTVIGFYKLKPIWINGLCCVKIPTKNHGNKPICSLLDLVETEGMRRLKIRHKEILYYRLQPQAQRLLLASFEQREKIREKLLDELES